MVTVTLTLAPLPASGYFVSHPKPLGALEKSADIVVKAKVLTDVPVIDPWFDTVSGFEAREAELAVVSVIKGAVATRLIRFRHYAAAPGGPVMYEPLSVSFTLQRTYVVFASDAGGGVYRQLTKSPSLKHGEGVTLAADDKPHRGATSVEAVWGELGSLLASASVDDAAVAVRELDERSGGRRTGLSDFARKPVLDLLRPRLRAAPAALQEALITVFGTLSPYTDDSEAPYWLAGMGKAVISGLTARTIVKNTDADTAVAELTAIADSGVPAERRALAIRALGRVTSRPAGAIARWFADADPAVRRAAVLLAADVPDLKIITAAVADPSDVVRQGAARAIGFAQVTSLLPSLDTLLRDRAAPVRMAAALSLLSFSPDDTGAVLTANLGSDYRALFVNALARKDPSLYLPELAEVIEKGLQPADWWGGRIPAGESWSILFDHVKKQPAAVLQQKRLARSLDALEHLHWFGSAEPRDLYALYLARGLGVRARAFRAAAKKSVPFDMEHYFDMVDKSPATYVQP
jgi:hypothetical protein